MRALLLTVAFAACACAADYVTNSVGVLLPDPVVTPGVVRTTDAKEICAQSFRTKPFRKTTQAMKKAVCAAYGVKRCPHAGTLELDHLCPLELGCADDIRNLWPEPASPAPGYHQKDTLENFLKSEVCAGHLALETAQRQIMTDWYSAWLAIPRKPRK